MRMMMFMMIFMMMVMMATLLTIQAVSMKPVPVLAEQTVMVGPCMWELELQSCFMAKFSLAQLLKSCNQLILWHVACDDGDEEDMSSAEAMQAVQFGKENTHRVGHGTGPHYVTSNAIDSLGTIPFYSIDGERKMPAPYPFHYRFRGKALRHLSPFECHALVGIVKKKEQKQGGKRAPSQEENSLCTLTWGQAIQ